MVFPPDAKEASCREPGAGPTSGCSCPGGTRRAPLCSLSPPVCFVPAGLPCDPTAPRVGLRGSAFSVPPPFVSAAAGRGGCWGGLETHPRVCLFHGDMGKNPLVWLPVKAVCAGLSQERSHCLATRGLNSTRKLFAARYSARFASSPRNGSSLGAPRAAGADGAVPSTPRRCC